MSTQNIFGMTDTWNAGATTFTAIGMNVTDTASAAGSLLFDLQVGGVSQFRVSKAGALIALGRATIDGLTIGKGGATAVSSNTAFGVTALNSASLTGAQNTAIGNRAGEAITTASSNTLVGHQAGLSLTTGGTNVGIGRFALTSATTAADNVAVGHNALLFYNTNNNVAIGREALQGSATVANNTGANNVAVGFRALQNATSGTNNIAVGYQAGDALTTGSTNIVIGHDLDVDSATGSSQINIGGVYFHNRFLYTETTDPAAPAANQAVVFARDNGAGKTQLCVRFNTGAVQVLATEP